jgi:hypothetical protein
MPRAADRPSESKIQWLSEDEKQKTLARTPPDLSFSNWVRQLLGLPPLVHGGSRKEESMKRASEIANLRSQIATNEAMAAACEKTFEETGRQSAANQAAQHRAAAERKRARIAKLEAEGEETNA